MNIPEKAEISFPCPWELRVIAFADKLPQVRRTVMELMASDGQAPGVTDGNNSAGGKYAALRVTITARSREHLDHFCRVLAAVDGVKMII